MVLIYMILKYMALIYIILYIQSIIHYLSNIILNPKKCFINHEYKRITRRSHR